MGVRLFKRNLLALVDTASENLDQSTLEQITRAQLMRKAATERHTTSDLKWQDAQGIGHGTQTKGSPGCSFHESRTAYTYACQAGPTR